MFLLPGVQMQGVSKQARRRYEIIASHKRATEQRRRWISADKISAEGGSRRPFASLQGRPLAAFTAVRSS